jgi:methyl-accepting chemotaxis protein
MREIAQGDCNLPRRMDASSSDEFADMAEAFNQFAGKVHDILKRLAGLSSTLSETTSKVSDAADENPKDIGTLKIFRSMFDIEQISRQPIFSLFTSMIQPEPGSPGE